jgi:hypothetical protein
METLAPGFRDLAWLLVITHPIAYLVECQPLLGRVMRPLGVSVGALGFIMESNPSPQSPGL